jgi:hypothetical protein
MIFLNWFLHTLTVCKAICGFLMGFCRNDSVVSKTSSLNIFKCIAFFFGDSEEGCVRKGILGLYSYALHKSTVT